MGAVTGLVFVSVLLFNILIGVLCGTYAVKKGRDSTLWFILGVFLGILAMLALLVIAAEDRESVTKNSQEQEPLSETEEQPLGTPTFSQKWERLSVTGPEAEIENEAALTAKTYDVWWHVQVEATSAFNAAEIAEERQRVDEMIDYDSKKYIVALADDPSSSRTMILPLARMERESLLNDLERILRSGGLEESERNRMMRSMVRAGYGLDVKKDAA